MKLPALFGFTALLAVVGGMPWPLAAFSLALAGLSLFLETVHFNAIGKEPSTPDTGQQLLESGVLGNPEQLRLPPQALPVTAARLSGPPPFGMVEPFLDQPDLFEGMPETTPQDPANAHGLASRSAAENAQTDALASAVPCSGDGFSRSQDPERAEGYPQDRTSATGSAVNEAIANPSLDSVDRHAGMEASYQDEWTSSPTGQDSL